MDGIWFIRDGAIVLLVSTSDKCSIPELDNWDTNLIVIPQIVIQGVEYFGKRGDTVPCGKKTVTQSLSCFRDTLRVNCYHVVVRQRSLFVRNLGITSVAMTVLGFGVRVF
jgi:hypothetical protein